MKESWQIEIENGQADLNNGPLQSQKQITRIFVQDWIFSKEGSHSPPDSSPWHDIP
jgi:hypothetical protein